MTYVYEHALKVMKPGYTHEDVNQVLRALLIVLRRIPVIEMPQKVPHGFFDKVAKAGLKLIWGGAVGLAKGAIEELGSLASELMDSGEEEVRVKKAAKKVGAAKVGAAKKAFKKTAKKAAKKATKKTGAKKAAKKTAKKTAKRGSAA